MEYKNLKLASIFGVCGLIMSCSSLDDVVDVSGIGTSLGASLGLISASPTDEMMADNDGQANEGVTVIPAEMQVNAPAPLNVGDRFVFDNPEITWQVVGRSGNVIYWQADNGDTQITDANPILPALEWRSSSRGTGKRVISGLTGNMFPLEIGKTISFNSAVTTDQPPYNWQFTWVCTTNRFHETNTPLLGRIGAYEIICGRQSQDEIVFDYSPEVGHYVRMEARGLDGFGRTVRNLIAYSRAGGMQMANAANNQMNQNPTNQMNNAMAQQAPNNQMQQNQAGFNAGGQAGSLLPSESLAAGSSFGGNILSSSPALNSDQQTGNLASLQGQSLQGQQNANLNGSSQSPGFGFGLGTEGLALGEGESLFAPTPSPNQSAGQTASTGGFGGNAAGGTPTPTIDGGGNNLAGGTLIHLASYRKLEAAERGWEQLSTQYGDILSGLSSVVREVDVPDKGVYQRLYVGPVVDEGEARDLCRRLQSRGAYCAVVR